MIAGAALALSGCATSPQLMAPRSDETWPELEPLLAADAGADVLTIRMRTRGCATRADFVFRVDRAKGRAVVAFARRRLEACVGPAGAIDLVFSYDELGLKRGERIVIANPAPPRR